MGPVCVECQRVMLIKKTGISVAPVDIPDHTRNGDLYFCPECGYEIMSGFGASYHNSLRNPDLYLLEHGQTKLQLPHEGIKTREHHEAYLGSCS